MAKTKKVAAPKIQLPDGKVRRRLIEELLVSIKGIAWPIEMRMMNCLLKKYNDPDFWSHFARRHKYQSLTHLLSEPHVIFSSYLDYTKHRDLNLKSPESVQLQPEKIGEDIIIQQKPKTLLDFIK
jgi:hypothetical protein